MYISSIRCIYQISYCPLCVYKHLITFVYFLQLDVCLTSSHNADKTFYAQFAWPSLFVQRRKANDDLSWQMTKVLFATQKHGRLPSACLLMVAGSRSLAILLPKKVPPNATRYGSGNPSRQNKNALSATFHCLKAGRLPTPLDMKSMIEGPKSKIQDSSAQQ